MISSAGKAGITQPEPILPRVKLQNFAPTC